MLPLLSDSFKIQLASQSPLPPLRARAPGSPSTHHGPCCAMLSWGCNHAMFCVTAYYTITRGLRFTIAQEPLGSVHDGTVDRENAERSPRPRNARVPAKGGAGCGSNTDSVPGAPRAARRRKGYRGQYGPGTDENKVQTCGKTESRAVYICQANC